MRNMKGSVGNGNGINKGNEKKDEQVVVAIDKDKGSQFALKWAVDNLLSKGSNVTLIHVKQRPSSIPTPSGSQVSLTDVNDGVSKAMKNQTDNLARELFLPYRAFCTRKDITCKELILEDTDIAKGLCDYVKTNIIANIVVGAPSRSSFVRFRTTDVPTGVSKGAPLFCSVYVVSKGKVSSVRAASMPLPNPPPRQFTSQANEVSVSHDLRPHQLQQLQSNNGQRDSTESRRSYTETPVSAAPESTQFVYSYMSEDSQIKSPFDRHKRSGGGGGGDSIGSYAELTISASDLSFVSSGRQSFERTSLDDMSGSHWPSPLQHDSGSDTEGRSSFGSIFSTSRFQGDPSMGGIPSGFSYNSDGSSHSNSNMDEVEAEMRRLKQELRQTMDMYSTACKEALSAKQKANELQRWKMEEQQKLEEAKLSEEAALAIAEKEKAKTKAAIEAAEAAQKIAELEAKKRISAERKALKEAEEKKKVLDALAHKDIRYRKYTIEEIEAATDNFANSRKIGEGGYGPVYKCNLDHTPVAVKVLRPDAAQGRSQFQQEVEVLSCIRHPNMVLLLGACPEYGCLVYEYMANGSLEDCLGRRGNTQPLPWQLRFRIAAEIATGLLFLHQTKPEPLVHRDLKPANILLDRNFVSKISDVGLARLVPPSVADTVTQYRMTATAGTFCYIDPEYQQTGMLGIKSDIYSLGIMLLQIITAKPPMGLTHHVERSIEKGTFKEMLDPSVPDWPVEEALVFAKMALKCAELRRKDRPDLKTAILPELNRLRALAEKNSPDSITMLGNSTPPTRSQVSTSQETISGFQQSGYRSSECTQPSA